MKIATWNINSIKVRLPAVTQYIQETSPYILALQETKSQDENFPKAENEKLGYSCVFTGQKTYNGVALIFKKTLSDINLNPIKTPENEKRSIAAVFDKTLILNLYVVNGQDVGTDKYQYKLRWLQTVFDYLKELRDELNVEKFGPAGIKWMRDTIQQLHTMEDLSVEEKFVRDEKRIRARTSFKRIGWMYMFNYQPLHKDKEKYYIMSYATYTSTLFNNKESKEHSAANLKQNNCDIVEINQLQNRINK